MGTLSILLLLSVAFALVTGAVHKNPLSPKHVNHHNNWNTRHWNLGNHGNNHNWINWRHRNNHHRWNHLNDWRLLKVDSASDEWSDEYVPLPERGSREKYIPWRDLSSSEEIIPLRVWSSSERHILQEDISESSEERNDERRIMERLIRHLRIEHPYRVCPQGWHGHGTHCYHYIPFKTTWPHAEVQCCERFIFRFKT
ncbi:hypothetical protein UPYG_G00243990 [Umbra pygmaea]|uniref:Uncharacterized protein n=1 Tax=Umbra pygmaea TaxID=75934 RepID=A0ABD0WFY1_UMBPY